MNRTIAGLCSLTIAAAVIVSTVGLTGPAYAHTPQKFRKVRQHVRARAKDQIGTPYRSGGSSPYGFDCSGLTRWVFRRHAAYLPHSSSSQFYLPKHRPNFRRVWKRPRLKVGDLVFHKTTSARVGHAGIYIGNGRFISATSSGGVRVRSIWDPHYWGPRWVGATRVPKAMKG